MSNDSVSRFMSETSPGIMQFGDARMALLDIESGFWGIRRQIEALIGSKLAGSVLQQAGANGGASFARSFSGQTDVNNLATFTACIKAYQAAGFGKYEILKMEWPLGRIQIQASDSIEAWMYQRHHQKTNLPICDYTAGVFVGFVNILGSRQDVVCVEYACQAKGDENCLFELLPASQAEGQVAVGLKPDPGLGRQINLLEMLFERMPMGIAVLDRQFHIQRYNPTWGDFATRYAPPSAAPLTPGVGYFEHQPGTETVVKPLFERVLEGETIQQNAVRLESEGIVSYWNIVLAPLIEKDEVHGILAVAVDASEQVEIRQNLEQRVEERTHELRTLLQVSRNLNSSLDLESLLEIILDQLKTVVDYTGASIFTLEGNDIVLRAYQGPIPAAIAQNLRFPIEQALLNNEVFKQQQPLIIADVRGKTDLARMFRQTAGDKLESTFGYVRAWMGVPLMVKGNFLGMLTLDHSQPSYFSQQHADLVLAFANHAAVAIENAWLYREAERRAEESETLFSVQQAITSKLEMDEILQMIADEARRLTKTDISAVYLLERDELVIAYVSGDVPKSILGYRLALDGSIAGSVVRNQETILVSDTWTDARVDREAADRVKARSLLIVPLISGQHTIGTITVANQAPGGFDPEDEHLLTKLATSVVISLDNAHLYQAESNRREVAESMRDIVRMINSSMQLEDFLKRAVELAAQQLGAAASILQKYDFLNQNLVYIASHNMPVEFADGYARPFDELQKPGTSDYLTTLAQGNPSYVNYPVVSKSIKEIEQNPNLSEEAKLQHLAIRKSFAGALAVPLLVQDEIFGAIVFYYREPQEFDEEQIQLAMTYAEQVALAIENSRLHEAAEEAAVAAERNRLARDLHDAVTQTLFSSSMIADVLPKIWDRNPEEGRRRLEELRQLTRGALSEMRTLLVELRPAALADTDLSDLIGHQVNAFIARTRIPVEYERQCSHNPPPVIKEVFYRIVQETFNNISKHAEATLVTVRLDCSPERVELQIQDNGIGFNTQQTGHEGLGLTIMKERARSVEAEFEIQSQLHQGTHLRMVWHKPGEN